MCASLIACLDVHLCDVSVLLLPVLQRLLEVLLPQSLDGSNLELIVRQQLSELLWRHTDTHRVRHVDLVGPKYLLLWR